MFSASVNPPSRNIGKTRWYLNPVPCSPAPAPFATRELRNPMLFAPRKILSRKNPAISQSRPNCVLKSRIGSIPPYDIPCLKCPFLPRSAESRGGSIRRDPVPRRKIGPRKGPKYFKFEIHDRIVPTTHQVFDFYTLS